jgi:NADPH:quinone reductase-like Zn-dependent oxidoreductase
VDYRREAWDRALKAADSKPVDAVLDFAGGRDVEQAGRRLLAREGKFVTVVGPERFVGDHALGWSGVLGLLAQAGWRMVSSRIRGPRYSLTGPTNGSALAEVAALAEAGVVPPIDSIIPFELEAMRHALQRAAAHQNRGRIVIQIDE